jgi:hypothetical protein
MASEYDERMWDSNQRTYGLKFHASNNITLIHQNVNDFACFKEFIVWLRNLGIPRLKAKRLL